MLICSLYFASWLCFPPMPIICNPITYDKKATFTAYNAVPEQTDADPCTTASGYNICEQSVFPRIAASNIYKFGTIIHVDGYGRFTIEDRTSRKYSDRIDLLFERYEDAIQFGKRELRYRVIK